LSTTSPADREVKIRNLRGLHARAAAKFVKLAGGFDARVSVSKNGQTVSGESIMGLMMLAAGPGCTIRLSAEGNQAAAALDALCDLVEAKFHED
jgi:phosphocarrier protein